MAAKTKLTPLMQQYFDIKAEYPHALLLFQVGDFYELFFDDAQQAAATLGIALTKRGTLRDEPIPLCGVPLHALDHYLVKLVKLGFNVAICDQLEPPKPGTVVKRGVTRVLTPGTLTDQKLLDDKSASYVCTLFPLHNTWGLLFGELLTGQLFTTTVPNSSDKALEAELIRFFPDEVVLPDTKLAKKHAPRLKQQGYCTTFVEHNTADEQMTLHVDQWLAAQFNPTVVKQVKEIDALRNALAAFYAYMHKNQQESLAQFHTLYMYKSDDFLIMDGATQRNLELIRNSHDGTRANTLFSVLDGAVTSMGSRMIKKWLLRPLIKKEAIEQRFDVIQNWLQDARFVQQLEHCLSSIGDIERVIGRIALNRAQLHDYRVLKDALHALPECAQLLNTYVHLSIVKVITEQLVHFEPLVQLLDAALNDDMTTDWFIKKGFDKQLDELRELVTNAHTKVAELERAEQEKTDIPSLKIRFNQAHGYYIEITKTHFDKVPERYIRQQTLVGRERYTIKELQELEHKIFTANNEIEAVEKQVFDRVKIEVVSYISRLRKLAHAIAHTDALLGFVRIAYNNGYVRPHFNEQRDILIHEGRHPVVEANGRVAFIPNNTTLNDQEALWIVTGPNMGGKSTYLRQVALINIMAQCGSFVPAQSASLPLLDRIFTRIGASDNVAAGKSTFLVEMEETASICTQATCNSLVILDEVGRGTSTFDGLAIAQAVVEYIYKQVNARCLFATHYHELTQLQEQYPGIVSYHAASRKTDNGIVFLYKMQPGAADGSFGIEVAKLAALPNEIVERAHSILHVLTATEQKHTQMLTSQEGQLLQAYEQMRRENESLKQSREQMQQKLNDLESFTQSLQDIDYNNLSPKQAFDLLWSFKQN